MAPAPTTGYMDFKVSHVTSKPVESPALIYAEYSTSSNDSADEDALKNPLTPSNGSIHGDGAKSPLIFAQSPAIKGTVTDDNVVDQYTTEKSNPHTEESEGKDKAAASRQEDQLPAPVKPDVKEEPARPVYNGKIPPPPKTVKEISEDIVDVLELYRLFHSSDNSKPWGAKTKLLAQAERFVAENKAICMVLPAFPFKSPNKKTKVLGDLPDRGEEIALQHLDGLCRAIEDVYPRGGRVKIVSDGLMYNDILGVSDKEVWRYGQALRQLTKELGCNNLEFVRLRDLLDLAEISEPLFEDDYLRDAPSFRDGLVTRYLPQGFDASKQIADDADTCLTYRGYIKFLETDLSSTDHGGEQNTKAQIKRRNEEIAKKMIGRGKAFANSIVNKFSDYVRLSIHPSTETTKLSIALIPQKGRSPMTPWHSALVQALDGSITMSHALSVPARTHELIYENGRPYYFRERSPLYHWPGMDVSFNYMYPCGLIVRPTDPTSHYSLHNVHMQKVRGLAEACSPVVLRGFADTTEEHTYEAKAYDLGQVAPWTFGIKQKVKDAGRNDRMANNVVSSEAMPMHYDGMFKFVKKTDEKTGEEVSVSNPPRFQYFTSISPSPPGSGYTLFSSSALFFQHLPPRYSLEELSALTWDCKNSGFWDNHMTNLPLVVPHPASGKPCVRWHEPWPEWKTKFANCVINIENGSNDYIRLVDRTLFDRRVCLYFSWMKGDVLVSDNFSMLHTRTAFEGESDRELWRIHCD